MAVSIKGEGKMYQLSTDPNVVIRLNDYANIPRGHRWWAEYEAWRAEGHEAAPAVLDYLEKKRIEINAWSDQEMAAGFEYEGHRYQSDIESREALMRTLIAGTGSVTGYWIDEDNQRVEVKNHAAIEGMYAALQTHSNQIFARMQLMKEEVIALSQQELALYSVGWPE